MMDSTYSVVSLVGLVSSKRRWQRPPGCSATSPKLRQMLLAWPMCRYPLGSGGKRVMTRPPNRLEARSSAISLRMKLGAGSLGGMASLYPEAAGREREAGAGADG